jgi:4-diphosphocytidyl-2-C-methyl-D-erythritol kinase
VPGKVNLHLSVGPRRPDGYHDVTTVFQAVSLYDDLTASGGSHEITCTTSGEGAGDVPTGSDNLAVAAALRLAVVAGVDAGVRLHVVKHIPVSGGMAGGSADAAAALVACDALWQSGLDREDLDAIAATLGSDVPFLLHGGSALGVGRGEQVSAVLARGQFHWVLGLAARGMSTASVYEEHDRGDPLPVREPDAVLAALRAADAVALGRALHNDLQAAALRLRPALRKTIDAGLERGAVGAVVSGSGPTVAYLCASRGDAVALAAGLAGSGVCRAVRTAYGPVPGARIVGEA